MENLGIKLVDEDRTNFLNIDKKFEVDLESKKSGLPCYDNTIKCYTDGSRMNNITGFGYIISDGDIQIDQGNGCLGKNASVFQGEILAIQQACLKLGNLKGDITFFTDSMSSVDTLCKLRIKSKVVKNCIQELNNLAKDRSVRISWIRSHSNFCGNEVADSEAKLGVSSHNWLKIPTPIGFLKGKIHKAFMKKWNDEWTSNPSLFKQTKIFFPVINTKQSMFLQNLSRKQLSHVVQVISGHNRLRYHESKINQNVDPLCRLCGEEDETAFHLIGECPVLFNKRAHHFHKYLLDECPDWNPRQLVNMINGSCLLSMLDATVQDPVAE